MCDRPNWLTNCMTDLHWLIDWLTGWLANQLAGWLTAWPIGWRSYLLTDLCRLIDWLIDWQTDWSNKWLIKWHLRRSVNVYLFIAFDKRKRILIMSFFPKLVSMAAIDFLLFISNSWQMLLSLLQNDPWPERPSGRLYRAIKYLRSIVRKLDALRFMLGLFSCGVIMAFFNRYRSSKQRWWIYIKYHDKWLCYLEKFRDKFNDYLARTFPPLQVLKSFVMNQQK